MITCSQVIKRSLVKLGVVPASGSPSPAQAEQALWALQGLYSGWNTQGVFGRPTDVFAVSDHDSAESRRITTELGDTLTITLPDTYEAGATDTVPDEVGLSEERAPRDLQTIVVTDSEETVAYIRDAYLGRYVRIDNLTLVSEAPLAERDPEGLACALAVDIASDYPGSNLTPQTYSRAKQFRASIALKSGSPRRESQQTPY